MADAELAIDRLAEGFVARFPAVARAPRWVGREAEFPLVDARGRAGDSARIWPALLEATGGRALSDPAVAPIGVETERWFCVAEVGRGTVEIGVGPRASLLELAADLDDALAAVAAAAATAGYRLLGYGIQPLTPPRKDLLVPKQRYAALVRAIGVGWVRWTVTASDQLHVDVGRDELIGLANTLNACSGAIVALTANSPVLGGRAGAHASSREALSARVSGEPFRAGAVPRAFVDASDYVRWTCGFRALVLPAPDGELVLPDVPYADLLASGAEPDVDTWLYHEHYVWPSARLRARLGTLEIRPACQQPQASFAASALSLGLVEAAGELAGYLGAELPGTAGWRRLLAFRREAVRRGLGAREPVPGFLSTLVDLALAGLERRGLGEADLLGPIRERLDRGRGPADEAREAFARAGASALVERFAIGR